MPDPISPETHPLDAVVAAVVARSGLAAPMDPYALSEALGLVLMPKRGALYALRGRALVFDPRWPAHVRLSMIARACAVHVLFCTRELRRSTQADIAWLTRALTGCAELHPAHAPVVNARRPRVA